jgi:hypothetical protein
MGTEETEEPAERRSQRSNKEKRSNGGRTEKTPQLST